MMEDSEDTRKDAVTSRSRAEVAKEYHAQKKITKRVWMDCRKVGGREDGGADDVRFLKTGERRVRGGTVALVSYPRSGNSMIRGVLELSTGLVTGSDVKPTRKLSKELAAAGFRGEGVVGRAWVVKTHYPERLGWKEFDATKAIVLVRNPFDAIDSHFNMILTRTHTNSIDESEYERFKAYWETHVLDECSMWCQFYQYWLQKAREGVPVLFVRYERLLLHRDAEVSRLLRFLCGDDTIYFGRCMARFKGATCSAAIATGSSAASVPSTLGRTKEGRFATIGASSPSSSFSTETESRTKHHVDGKRDTLVVKRKGQGTYRPRSGGIGKSLRHYSNGLRKRIFSQEAHLRTYLDLFGYSRILECDASLGDVVESKRRSLETARRSIGMRCVVEDPAYDPKTCSKTERVTTLDLNKAVTPLISTPSEGTRPSLSTAAKRICKDFSLRINDPKALLRKRGQSDPFARGVRWARVLHKLGVKVAPKKK